MKQIAIIIVSLLFAFIPAIAAESLSAQADSAYNKEDYAQAVALYNQILKGQGRSADVYYNLGNAWYRRGNAAQAVLAYERALRVDPTHSDARDNLKFVNSRLEDKPEDNNSFLTSLHLSIVKSAEANTWAWVTLICFALLCSSIAAYIFSSSITIRKIGFFGAIILLIVTIYFVVVAIKAANLTDDNSEAVVVVPTTLLNSAPRQPKQIEKVVPLHEGTKVQIVDSVSTPDDPISPMWYNVRINGSANAWLRATDVERI